MTVIVCIDDARGMTFNKRRQSRDVAISKDVLRDAEGKKLLASPFSKLLFADITDRVIYDDDPLEVAKSEDVVFIEDKELADHSDKISEMIIYKWNKKYPSDKKLDIDPLKIGLKLRGTYEFKGNSHDKITKEVYRK